MYKYEEPTPCPAPPARKLPNGSYGRQSDVTYAGRGFSLIDIARRESTLLTLDEDTENVDFTTEFRSTLNNAAPRRRRTTQRRTSTRPSSIRILEEEGPPRMPETVKEEGKIQRDSILIGAKDTAANRRKSVLAQPAHRPVVVGEHAIRRQHVDGTRTKELEAGTEKFDVPRGPLLKKEPRRRTIYVPSDDTTILTIHPGASINEKQDHLSKPTLSSLEILKEEEPPLADQVVSRRNARKSLAAAPKRVPLKQTGRPVQGTVITQDIMGQGNGKENIPPGHILAEKRKTLAGPKFELRGQAQDSQQMAPINLKTGFTKESKIMDTGPSSPRKRTSSSSGTQEEVERQFKRRDPLSKPIGRLACSKREPEVSPILRLSAPSSKENTPSNMARHRKPEKVPSKLSVPLVGSTSSRPMDQYPVLSDDISRPELYEDNWLSYQETAIMQLMNSLFDSAANDYHKSTTDSQQLRDHLLALYHEQTFSLLYKRLQASLLYGALSIPKELLAQTLRLRDDVGMRSKFLNLWMQTYELPALRAAAEVVIGRQIIDDMSQISQPSIEHQTQTKAQRKSVELFLDTFIICHEDAVRPRQEMDGVDTSEYGSQVWSWRRTVLRSMMLILLLDIAKKNSTIQGVLFLPSSPHKSSESVLQALGNLLLPSLGDILRPLRHLKYEVDHVQYPLQEYSYRLTNIATDLRDGVRLTRLVELLLYPPSTLSQQNGDVTITMPTGEILTSRFHDPADCWVLSQHLKFPCIGRAQKLYNVQLALSALEGLPHVANFIKGVLAEDVVDGFREKTLGLLWTLVSRWGIGQLIDWEELEKEVSRLKGRYRSRDLAVEDEDSASEDEADLQDMEGAERHTFLLKLWAKSVARLHGLRVTNLSSSFADGHVFESIVREYEEYFPQGTTSSKLDNKALSTSTLSSTRCSPPAVLKTKLIALGCSNAFASLFTPLHTPHLNPSLTIPLLTFLCSRLLQPSRLVRAAKTIQRAWHGHLTRRMITQRVMRMRLAHDCAMVVTTRERVVGAAVVIQTAWRKRAGSKEKRERA